MSWREALEDGIHIAKDSNKFNYYCPPCHICGVPVYSWSYIRGYQYTCKECRNELVRQTREEGIAIGDKKKQKKLAVAIKRISKVTNITPYKNAIRLVEQSLKRRGWYQSTEEIMVAIELIRRGVRAYHQVRIFEYTVDCHKLTHERFCDEHAKVEARRYEKDDRDPAIKKRYNRQWQRIRDRYIAEHPLCELCEKHGRTTPAEEVHHIKPLSDGGTHDEVNLMALCKVCHSTITAREGGRWRKK